MNTIQEYCEALEWTLSDLSREARIAWQTARDAWNGKEPAPRTKRDIVAALSKAYRRDIPMGEVQWKRED